MQLLRKELALDAAELNDLILQSVVDHAIITLDRTGRVTSWNKGAEQILGWTEEEIIGQSADVFFTPEDVENDRPEVEMTRALADGRAEDERWHRKKNGQRFWASGLMMPLRSKDQADAAKSGTSQAAKGFVKIFRDRTFHYEAQQRIARLENRASLAMRRSGTVGVYELDTIERLIVSDGICADLHDVDVDVAAVGVPVQVFLDSIHRDDIAKVALAMDEAIATGSDMDQIYRAVSTGPRARWLHSQAAVQFDTDGRPARLSGIVVDITTQHERIRMQEAQLHFIDTVRDYKTVDDINAFASLTIAKTLNVARAGHGDVAADGDTVQVRADWAAPEFASLVGPHRFSAFGSFSEKMHRGETIVVEDVLTQDAIANPSAFLDIGSRSFVNVPLMDNGRMKALMFVHDDQPREWSTDEVRFMQAILDRTYAATDRLNYEIERNVMAAELAHRMKNMLTVAQVIVSQSLRNVTDIDTARQAIKERLRALGKAQDVLTEIKGTEASIASVVKSALLPHADASRISASGDRIVLNPQQVLGLSLALHELGTNAVKYGALSCRKGNIDVRWTNSAGRFQLEWRETGGPKVVQSTNRGFGSTILTKVVGGYFQGETDITFAPEGLVYRIDGSL